MGLNDLTLEKLISEINGYKEKMRAIHEDYGRASQDLQDRINVLGYNLNEHLKQTKDQMATCTFGADDQKLAGQARTSFLKKCMANRDDPRGPAAVQQMVAGRKRVSPVL